MIRTLTPLFPSKYEPRKRSSGGSVSIEKPLASPRYTSLPGTGGKPPIIAKIVGNAPVSKGASPLNAPMKPTAYGTRQVPFAGLSAPQKPPSTGTPIDYSSVEGMELSKKIAFLKDLSINPRELPNGFDHVNAVLYRWNLLYHNLEAGNYTDERKKQITGMFYDREVLPAWDHMNTKPNGNGKILSDAPPTREQWLAHAGDVAGNFDIDRSYAGLMYNGAGHGFMGFFKDIFRATSTVNNFFAALTSPPKEITDESWAKDLKTPSKGFWTDLQDTAEANPHSGPMARKINNFLNTNAEKLEFLQALRPNHGFVESAMSGVVETVPWLAAEFFSPETTTPETLAKGYNVAESLAGTFRSEKAGQLAAGMMRGARDGGVYGLLTRKNEDKHKAGEDAMYWAAGNALMDIGIAGFGKLYGYLAAKWGTSLADRITKDFESRGELLKAGREEATPDEIKNRSEAGVAHTIAADGLGHQQRVDNNAAAYLVALEKANANPEDVRKREQAMLEDQGPAGTAGRIFLDAVARLRAALAPENLKLTEMSTEQRAAVLARLQALNYSAASKLTTHVKALQEALRQRILSMPPERMDRGITSFLLQQVAPNLPPGATPEQASEAVKKAWADLVVKAGVWAEEEGTKDPLSDALRAAQESSKARVTIDSQDAKASLARTRRWTSKAGEPSVSYSFSPAWKVQAQARVKASGREWTKSDISDWLKDLSEEDFAADIAAYFLPRFSKDHNLHFEVRKNSGGYDFTNLYAFAYNWKDSMPTEYAERLEEEYFNSSKMRQVFDAQGAKGVNQREAAARKMSLIMFNHVDNLLDSGRFPKETNVFGSTQQDPDLNNPTKWMHELFEERKQAEAKIIDRIYKKDTPENQAAKDALGVAFKHRERAYKKGDPVKFRELSREIATKIQKDSKGRYEDWGLQFPQGGGEDIQSVVHGIKNPEYEQNRAIVKTWEEARARSQKAMDDANARRTEAHERRMNSDWGSPEREAATRDYDKARADWQAAFTDHYSGSGERTNAVYEAERKSGSAYHGRITQDKQGRTTLWLSRQMINKYQLGTAPFSVFQTLHGQNIGKADIDQKLHLLDQFLGDPKYDTVRKDLKDLLTKARDMSGREGVNLTVIEGQSPKEWLSMRSTFREEWAHGWQRSLLGDFVDNSTFIQNHLDQQVSIYLHSIIPQGMKDYLAKHYSHASDKLQVIEAGAKLLTQHPSTFNMSTDQAADWLIEYGEAITDKYGDDAFKHLTTAVGIGKDLKSLYASIPKP